jgi:uncharacterized membrane protein
VKSGSAWGVFWGLLFGVLFTIPLLGIAAGASIGALHKMTAGVGIKEDDIKRIRGEITEGTSALFVVTEEGNLDRVAERFHGLHETLIDSNLTGAERHALLEAFDSD